MATEQLTERVIRCEACRVVLGPMDALGGVGDFGICADMGGCLDRMQANYRRQIAAGQDQRGGDAATEQARAGAGTSGEGDTPAPAAPPTKPPTPPRSKRNVRTSRT